MDARIVWPVGALLGEGPIWIAAEATLCFVDIKQGKLHSIVPGPDERRTIELGGQPSFAVTVDRGGLIVGNGHELVRVARDGATETIATIDMPAGNRTNDATVDRFGRLWFGTMDDGETAPTGRVYRFDGALREMGGACAITNGPAISPDGRYLYHVDTLARQIWRFDIGANPGQLGDGGVFVEIAEADGNPDGVTIDSEGCLWVALWGGWALRRYSAAGDLLASVSLPCANVTKVAFGGPDLTTGYVTSARIGLSDGALAEQPLAGGLFAFDAPAPGLAPHAVRLGA